MALPRKRKDAALDTLGCQETLEDHEEDLATLPKRIRASLEDGASGELENVSSSCSSGRATLQVDVGDYECSICLQILVDPVVGGCIQHIPPVLNFLQTRQWQCFARCDFERPLSI